MLLYQLRIMAPTSCNVGISSACMNRAGGRRWYLHSLRPRILSFYKCWLCGCTSKRGWLMLPKCIVFLFGKTPQQNHRKTCATSNFVRLLSRALTEVTRSKASLRDYQTIFVIQIYSKIYLLCFLEMFLFNCSNENAKIFIIKISQKRNLVKAMGTYVFSQRS